MQDAYRPGQTKPDNFTKRRKNHSAARCSVTQHHRAAVVFAVSGAKQKPAEIPNAREIKRICGFRFLLPVIQ